MTWSLAVSNYPVLQSNFSGYRDFASPISGSYLPAVQAAFDAWEAVANIDFIQVLDGPGVNIRMGDIPIDGRAAPGQVSTLGTAQSWYRGSYLSAAQIYFDVDAYDSSRFYEVAVHEIGHAIGLEHSASSSAVMYFQTNAQNQSGALTMDDIQAATAIYGPRVTKPSDDYPGSTASTGTVAPGGSLSGAIEVAGDTDWIRVTLVAGHAYRLDLEGAATGRGSLQDPRLEIRTGDGAMLRAFDDGGVAKNAAGGFVAATSGAYFLTAAAASDQTGTYRMSLVDLAVSSSGSAAVLNAGLNVLRAANMPASVELATRVAGGALSASGAIAEVVKTADATTSVATLSYQFFTGKIPGQPGIDYLVSPTGPNPNNLNSAYYQSFNLENRYINFAVNLGREGEGKAQFQAEYGNLTLAQTTKLAYAEIFGTTPTDAKVSALLSGGRDLYFQAYGQDGPNGQGAKAAMVGWLLAEAEKADIGQYAKSNAAFLTDLADGATFAVDLVGTYGKADFNYAG